MADLDIGILIVVLVLVMALLAYLPRVWHPYRWWIRRQQRLAFEGKAAPPTRSRYWIVSMPLVMFLVWIGVIWHIVRPRDGLAIVTELFSTILFLANGAAYFVYHRWREDTPKVRAGSFGDITVKDLWANRIQDVLTLHRIVEDPAQYGNEKDHVKVVKVPGIDKPVIAHTFPVEVFQGGGLSPKGPGITVPNNGPIFVLNSRMLSAEQAQALLHGLKQLKAAARKRKANGAPEDTHLTDLEHAWSGLLLLGDLGLAPGEPIFFLMGFDDDDQNPTPIEIRELVKRHATARRLTWKPGTWIVLVPDHWRGLAKVDTTAAPRPSNMQSILYDQAYYIEYLTHRNIQRGKSGQKMDSSERGHRGRREEISLDDGT